jgi:tetratricopeptide (TPR) repeat protein
MNDTGRMPMDAVTWSRVRGVLAVVLEAPAAQRPTLLDTLCVDDPALRAEVDALLACEDKLPEQLPAEIWNSLAEAFAQPDRRGERVGVFELESCLGEGGSSIVYAARRVDEFTQRVAIKLLRSHVGATVARRFVFERETLARLNHPHIAKLFDAGTLDNGTPYLVLELVQGRNWTQWLDDDRPPLRDRIAKFLSICSAVEHAHQRLLVHRDIKPTNLMIDADGRAMLLDFGIAKLLDDTQSATLTREGGFALTPAYAAPEQLRGEPVSTATDVYALGLVLYETLTAQHAFESGDAASMALHAQRSTLPPKRPSQTHAKDSHAVVATTLRGDLDNIVMKALEPEPGRRYAGVAALANDLRAFLDGRPVSARAPSWRYVAGKFVRRHRIGTALTALALIAVATALFVATQETARARRHLSEARALANDILTEYPEQIAELSGSLPVQARMVRDAMRYLDSLREVAGEDAALSRELAEGYLRIGDIQGNPSRDNLGDIAGAEAGYAQARVALDQWRRLAPGSDGIDLLQARLTARQAAIDHKQGRLEQAALRFREALAQFAALPSVERDAATVLEHATALQLHGDLLGNTGIASLVDVQAGAAQHAAARQMLDDALKRFPDDSALQLGMSLALERLGDEAFFARELPRASAAYDDAITRIEALLAVKPESVSLRRALAGMHARMAQVLDLDGDLDGAIVAATQSVTIVESLLAADPTNEHLRQGTGAVLGTLAKMLMRRGRFEDAGPIIDRQIAINQQRLDSAPGNAEMVLALSLGYRRRGEQHAGLGALEAARTAHETALLLQEGIAKESADYESHRALTLLHLGRIESRRGEGTAAIARLQQAIDAMSALVAAHPDVAVYREDLIDAEEALGDALTDRLAAAEHWLRALELIESFSGDAGLAPGYTQRIQTLRKKLAPMHVSAGGTNSLD